MSYTRRSVIGGAGALLLTFQVDGLPLRLSAAEARTKQIELSVLSAAEGQTLEALGDTLLPGAADSGIVHFIDNQLAKPTAEQLLMIRYLGVDPPYLPFYRDGLAAIEAFADRQYGRSFSDLEDEQRREAVASIAVSSPEGWAGPPAALFYFVLRSDAVDVVYGTVAGFERLDIPYMAHIKPPSPW